MNLSLLITPWRLKWYSIAVLSGIFVSVIIVLFSGSGPKIVSGRLGGDFPIFYAAGRMAAIAGYQELYDLEKQIEAQKDLYPDHKSYMPFPYPPFVALACIPLSFFPYRVAYILHLLLNLSAFCFAFVSLREHIEELDRFFLPVFTLSLTFYPFLKAVLNGQLTAITFMLFVLTWRFTIGGSQYLAGFCMGLLLYKPQFAIPCIGVFLLSGRLKTSLAALATVCLIVFISLFFTGIEPYMQWYPLLRWFSLVVSDTNGHNAVSWIGFMDAVFGTGNKVVSMLGYVCSGLTVLFISYVWAKGGTKSDFNAQMGLAAVCFVLLSPYMLFYDAGLIVLTYAFLIPKIAKNRIRLIGFVWLAGLTQLFSERVGFSPIFFLVVFTFSLSILFLYTPATERITYNAV
jgi:hypothetical protein